MIIASNHNFILNTSIVIMGVIITVIAVICMHIQLVQGEIMTENLERNTAGKTDFHLTSMDLSNSSTEASTRRNSNTVSISHNESLDLIKRYKMVKNSAEDQGLSGRVVKLERDSNIDIAKVSIPQTHMKSSESGWDGYHKMASSLGKQVEQVEDSLSQIEHTIAKDTSGSQMTSQLKMIRLIMTLLDNVKKNEMTVIRKNGKVLTGNKVNIKIDEHHMEILPDDQVVKIPNNTATTTLETESLIAAAADVPALTDTVSHIPLSHSQSNPIGWVVLLSTVVGIMLVGCVCAISQCVPIKDHKLQTYFKPKYSQISWENGRKSKPRSHRASHTFNRNTDYTNDLHCPASGNTTDSHKRIKSSCGNSFKSPIYGSCPHCNTSALNAIRARLDELKYTDEKNCSIGLHSKPDTKYHVFSSKKHNSKMARNPSDNTDCVPSEIDDSDVTINYLPIMPHSTTSGSRAQHQVKKCKAKGDTEKFNLLKLPHEN